MSLIKFNPIDNRQNLSNDMKKMVRGIANETFHLFQQLNGLEQQKDQLLAALSINSATGNKAACDQIDQQMRMLDSAIEKAYLLLADKVGVKS